jgi:sugar phosphate isomerase/epimerase
MYLALNTFVYEIAKAPIEEALHSADKFGFQFIEYAAYQSGDPTLMNRDKRNEVIRIFKNKGLECSQLLLREQHSQDGQGY